MSFGRTLLTVGLTSLTLGLLARGWSWMRHGPSKTTPPPDCPPRGARIRGLEVARREVGSMRAAAVMILVHDRGLDGERMLDAVPGLRSDALLLAPTGPMPTPEGAAWLWAGPQDDGFAWALESAGHGLAAFAREIRRCNPGRRVVLVGHGQGAHVGLAAAALDPTVADELLVVGGRLPSSWVPAALPATVMLHGAQAGDVELARAQAGSWAERGLPVRWIEVDGLGELAGPVQARLLVELERALHGRAVA